MLEAQEPKACAWRSVEQFSQEPKSRNLESEALGQLLLHTNVTEIVEVPAACFGDDISSMQKQVQTGIRER